MLRHDHEADVLLVHDNCLWPLQDCSISGAQLMAFLCVLSSGLSKFEVLVRLPEADICK